MTSGPGQASGPAADYTVDELMVARIADCFGNDDQVANGLASFIPVCAIQLARLIGYLDGNGERARLGIGGGPDLVVTNLAVLDFEPGSQRMRLKSVHSGITVEKVLAATGFAPVVPPYVPVTAPPTAEQVDLLRTRIDPVGYRKRGVR
jgi:hypothetical protein